MAVFASQPIAPPKRIVTIGQSLCDPPWNYASLEAITYHAKSNPLIFVGSVEMSRSSCSCERGFLTMSLMPASCGAWSPDHRQVWTDGGSNGELYGRSRDRYQTPVSVADLGGFDLWLSINGWADPDYLQIRVVLAARVIRHVSISCRLKMMWLKKFEGPSWVLTVETTGGRYPAKPYPIKNTPKVP